MMTLTNLLCAVIALVSYIGFSNRELFFRLMHHPYSEKRQSEYYRWLSSAFLHRDWTHLLVNLFVFYSFGNYVERIYANIFPGFIGKLMYLLLFVVSVLVANVPSYIKNKDKVNYSAIGASGGVSGVLFASILFEPWSPVLLFAVIPIPGIVFGVLYLGYEFYAERNVKDNIGHDAHFWGAVAGVVFTLIIYSRALSIFIQQLIHNSPFS